MNNIINIQTITWELETRSVAEAKDWQNTASGFSHHHLPTLIEEILAPYNDDYRNISIDVLELDIKDITNPEEIKRSLQKSVDAFFANYTGKEKYYNTERSYTFLEVLQYYLQYSHLPWHADKKVFSESALLLEQLKSYSSSQLKSAIHLTNDAAVIRLLQLLTTEENIKQFLEHIAISTPAETDNIVVFIQTIISLVFGTAQQHNNKIAIIYKALLQYSFSHQTFDIKTFLKIWWDDVVGSQLLTLPEQKEMTEYIMQHASQQNPMLPNITSVFIANHKEWVGALKAVIINTTATTVNAEPQQKKENPSNITSFYIENAGGILLYFYLRAFFKEAGLLNDAGLFISNTLQMQAVQLLQFAICGNSNFKEYELVLNKVLCGYDIEAPIIKNDNTKLYNIVKANRLLQQVINSWRKIGNASPDGLRQSFLLRNGKLVQETNNWLLYVERKGMDVLVDALPYPISVIKLPWMQKPMYVQW